MQKQNNSNKVQWFDQIRFALKLLFRRVISQDFALHNVEHAIPMRVFAVVGEERNAKQRKRKQN